MPSHSVKHTHHHLQQSALDVRSVTVSGAGTTAAAADRVEWSRTTILGFIEDYRRQRVLWDPNTKGYHIKQIKYEALKQLGQKYGTEIRSIRSKIKSLRSSFHREHGKVLSGKRRGVHYQPMWFAYEAIRFILDGETTQQAAAASDATKRGVRVGRSGAGDGDIDYDNNNVNEADDDDIDNDEVEERALVAAVETVLERNNNNNNNTSSSNKNQQRHNAKHDHDGDDDSDVDDDDADYDDDNIHNTNNNNGHAAVMDATNAVLTAAALRNASGCVAVSNIVAAAAAAAAAAALDEQAAVKRGDSDLDMSHYCNISAEDVKTELIESESSDVPKSLAYLALTPVINSSSSLLSPRKRKRTPQRELSSVPFKQQNGEHPSPSQVPKLTLSGGSHNNNNNNICGNNNNGRQQDSSMAGSSSSSPPSKHHSGGSSGNNMTRDTDEYGVFGEYVAITIRKLKTSKSKIVVKHLINNLLYEAELGKYDHGIPASKEPPQLYKTT